MGRNRQFILVWSILLVLAQAGLCGRPPKTLTDAQATKETRSLMSFLLDQYGQKILAGQQSFWDIRHVKSVTGKEPAVGAFDLMEYSPSRIECGANPRRMVERTIQWAKDGGGIVSLSWHWNAPTDLRNQPPDRAWWSGFYTRATTFDVEAALANPEGTKYKLLIRDMDAIAVELAKFQDAGLPVLWRPLHEASGRWFWWGAKGPEPFIQLWRLMYDRFVNYHGLHNLIWVFTTDGNPAWYPGDGYVDIVGMDIYMKPDSSMAGHWNHIQSRFKDVKLVTLSETGTLPDLEKVRKEGTWWSWFSVWNGYIGQIDETILRSVYDDKDVITLDELGDWKHYPVD